MPKPRTWKVEPDRTLERLQEHVRSGLKVIMASHCSLDPGDIMPGFEGEYGNQSTTMHLPMRVVREATYNEYMANYPSGVPNAMTREEQRRLGLRFHE